MSTPKARLVRLAACDSHHDRSRSIRNAPGRLRRCIEQLQLRSMLLSHVLCYIRGSRILHISAGPKYASRISVRKATRNRYRVATGRLQSSTKHDEYTQCGIDPLRDIETTLQQSLPNMPSIQSLMLSSFISPFCLHDILCQSVSCGRFLFP
jgi:hypothetical protein